MVEVVSLDIISEETCCTKSFSIDSIKQGMEKSMARKNCIKTGKGNQYAVLKYANMPVLGLKLGNNTQEDMQEIKCNLWKGKYDSHIKTFMGSNQFKSYQTRLTNLSKKK